MNMKTPITVMTMLDKNGNEIKPKFEKGYVLLMYIQQEGETDEIHEFAVVRGRDNVIDTIFNEYLNEYDYVDFFKSKVMSEDTSPNKAISLYTFIRMMLEYNKLSKYILDRLEKDFDIYDAQSFNEYIDNQWYDCMTENDIKDIDELDAYYKDSIENRNIEVG